MDRVDYQSLVVQDLINLDKAQELDTQPWYQRRSVWSTPQKSYLINTLFEKKPVPAIYIRHSLDLEKEKSIKEVVDGQQRVKSIISYANNEFKARHPNHKSRVSFSELRPTEKSNFLLTALAVGYLIGAEDSDVIDIFARINTVSKTLNEQEKRNARFSGEFKQFCTEQATKLVPFWRDREIFTANEIARMNEVQFMSDLVVNMLEGLTDYSSRKINTYYSKNEDTFPKREPTTARLDRIFSALVELPNADFTDTIFSRQPILFSLLIVLDDLPGKLKPRRIKAAIHEIDEKFNSDVPVTARSVKDAQFHAACTSSTQRIAQRKIRHNYILEHLQ